MFSSPQGGRLTRDQLSWIAHGLPVRPALPAAEELKLGLARRGLSTCWDSVKRAYALAERAHQGQQRDDGTPYVHHGARTLLHLVEKFGVTDPSALSAALLHDVLEDTSVTATELEAGFGRTTRDYVELVSKPDRLPGESYEQRNARYLARLEGSGKREVIALKLADRLDNIDDVHLMPDLRKVGRYLADTRDHYLPLARRHFPEVADELEQKLERAGRWLASTGA